VRALLADVDGTMTTAGLLRSSTLRALERVRDAGVAVVLVTGRPAGWGECWARTLPVAGVVVENGGLYFARGRRPGTLRRVYSEPEEARRRNRRRLWREVRSLLRRTPGARLSSDSAYTEVDLAIDWNEEAHLPAAAADRMVEALARRGVRCARSSVHVNCWLGPFDKLTASDRFARRELKLRGGILAPGRVVYVGDSLNDAPMFGAVPLSVGVANVMDVLHEIAAPPRFITRAREGDGFEELALAIVRAVRR
jgi:hypothetical protein